ncbi:MAG: RNA polymerase sigma factor [Myxococcota bacterium]|nr:RNA polymerase sigma factor [Myxococcota bacterium]
MTEDDDLTLLERWRRGDAAAGQALFRRHFESVYGFFVTKCPAEADELVQGTFMACLRQRDQFRGDSSFRTYMFAIARNQLYGALTARQKANARLDYAVSSIAQLVTTPGTQLARNEEHRQLVEALRTLPVEQQTLLELHYWQDLEIGQLAEIFEMNAAAIRQRLHRARKALRDQVERSAPPSALENLESMDVWVKGFAPRN